uniref:Zinc-finger domain-containing protein n=1 Tax=Solibacter usitatus (strain Ellin6076) TaxID=234267 RepID=Q01RB9_SOLUE
MTEPSSDGEFLRRALKPGADCLSVEKLEICLQDGPARPDLSRHLESCAHCRAKLDLLRSFYEAPRDSTEADAVRQIEQRLRKPRAIAPPAARSRWQEFLQVRWLSPIAVAMAGVLIVAAVSLEWRRHTAPNLLPLNAREESVFRSGKLNVTAPTGDLLVAPTSIRWQAIAGAATYRVRIMEVDHSELWTAATSESSVDLPRQIQAKMVPAKSLLLQVNAFDSSGRQLAESDVVRFRLLQKVYSR